MLAVSSAAALLKASSKAGVCIGYVVSRSMSHEAGMRLPDNVVSVEGIFCTSGNGFPHSDTRSSSFNSVVCNCKFLMSLH